MDLVRSGEDVVLSPSVVKRIDHAVLQPTHTDDDVRRACALCVELGTASVCVKPCHVPLAALPHGSNATETKVAEVELACRQGAREVDMVANIAHALSGNWQLVEAEIRTVVQTARRAGAITKVILETGLLPDDETKIRLCKISEVATGATEHDIRLMRANCGPAVQVKASGGIRSYDAARRFVELGATRLGTSATQEIAAAERGARVAAATEY
jgi:deoxyribose-phosphate aldolase